MVLGHYRFALTQFAWKLDDGMQRNNRCKSGGERTLKCPLGAGRDRSGKVMVEKGQPIPVVKPALAALLAAQQCRCGIELSKK